MLSFLQNVEECDATGAGLCTNADLIKNKNTFHRLYQIEKLKFITSNPKHQTLNFLYGCSNSIEDQCVAQRKF